MTSSPSSTQIMSCPCKSPSYGDKATRKSWRSENSERNLIVDNYLPDQLPKRHETEDKRERGDFSKANIQHRTGHMQCPLWLVSKEIKFSVDLFSTRTHWKCGNLLQIKFNPSNVLSHSGARCIESSIGNSWNVSKFTGVHYKKGQIVCFKCSQ